MLSCQQSGELLLNTTEIQFSLTIHKQLLREQAHAILPIGPFESVRFCRLSELSPLLCRAWINVKVVCFPDQYRYLWTYERDGD